MAKAMIAESAFREP